MHFFPEEGYKRFLVLLCYIIIGGLLFFLALRYLFSAFLPFLTAFCIAWLLRRPTVYLARKTHISRKLIASLLAIISVSSLLFGFGYGIWKLVLEIGNFAMAVISGENPLLSDLQNLLGMLGDMASKLPLAQHEHAEALRNTLTQTVLDTAKNIAVELGTKIPEFAAKLASAIPQVLIFGIVTIFSAVYFCADYDRFVSFFNQNIHGKSEKIIRKIGYAAKKTLLKVLKSYAVLFLFTFAQLLLGFVILKEPYAFLLALLTALIDSLPIFGTGTVLIPMALYRFLTGDLRTAVGFAVLYGIVTVVRQISEPKILGEGFGVHPLLMLIAMYTGFRLFGVFGMLFFPLAAVFFKNIFSSFREEKEAFHGTS